MGWYRLGKLADAFGVTLDYLIDTTGNIAEIRDKAMLARLADIDRLDSEDKRTILKVVDNLLRDAKAN